jgi:murein DD-endopeptidase MepM/ murein hydrolase activator NlpD
MIRLKSLLFEQQTDNIPRVLFIGDNSNSGYSKILQRRGVATVVDISYNYKKLTPSNFYKLVKRYVSNKYDMIILSFGKIGINSKNIQETIDIFSDLLDYANGMNESTIILQGRIRRLSNKTENTNFQTINRWLNTQKLLKGVINPNADFREVYARIVNMINVYAGNTDTDLSTPDTEPSSNIQYTPKTNIDINDSVVNQSAELLKQFEGFISKPMWDVNNWRIGFGSSTITRSNGQIITLSADRSQVPNVTITEDEAILDLKRRLQDEFIPATMQAIGGVTLPNNVVAALVSVVYNYGHLPNRVKQAVKSTPLSIENIANAVSSLTSNKTRRSAEAAFILKTTNDIQPEIQATSYSGPLNITSNYGMRSSGMHRGSDLRAVPGTTIYINKPGTVIFAGNRNPNGWGNMVEIQHDDGYITRYAHLSRIDVSTNDTVKVGDLIGLTGGEPGAPGSGNSRGAHLHWEWLPVGTTLGQNGESVIDDYFSFKKANATADSKTDTKKTDITANTKNTDTSTAKMHSILNKI